MDLSKCLNDETPPTKLAAPARHCDIIPSPLRRPAHIFSARRSSTASSSSFTGYRTAESGSPPVEYSPISQQSASPVISADFAAPPTPPPSTHRGAPYTSGSHSDSQPESRRGHSLDEPRWSYNSYAAPPPAYHASSPYYASEAYHPYSRPRAQSSPMGYTSDTSYAVMHPSHHPSPVPHSPSVYRGYTNAPRVYSTPPTPQDRREAHIRSEQKRRESINGGFSDLAEQLTSEKLMRALSLSCHHSGDVDADSKVVFDSTSILGGDRKNSKAVLLQKAVRAIDWLSKYAIDVHAENASLHRSKSQIRKSRHVKRSSTNTVVPDVDLVLSEDELKEETGCS